MEFLLTTVTNQVKRRVAWISLQPDGSVSVGLSDGTYVSPDFKAQHFLWNAYNRETLHYVVPSDTSKLKSIPNPHLSFHPPHWFHLTTNDRRRLFEGIADLELMLKQGDSVPWIRFVSNPIEKLQTASTPRKPERTSCLLINAPDENNSVGVGIDFMRTSSGSKIADALLDEFIPWKDFFLRVHAVLLPPQIATLSWFHQR